jgi:protein gp37
MGDKSKIEWTATFNPDGSVTPGATWNPLRARDLKTGKLGWHCVKISPACEHCYAWRQNVRFGTGLNYSAGSGATSFLEEHVLLAPLGWKRPRKIFVCSMTDLFGEWVPAEWIDRMFATMALAPSHTFIVLTKRPQRMKEYFADQGYRLAAWAYQLGFVAAAAKKIEAGARIAEQFTAGRRWPLPNVWLGATIEDHVRCMERLDPLLETPAAVRFISAEPLLGDLDLALRNWAHIGGRRDDCRIDWVIVGGESGAGARPMHPDWARLIRQDCELAGVPFFFKQWGAWLPAGQDGARVCAGQLLNCSDKPERVGKKAAGRLLDGREWNEFPAGERPAAIAAAADS